jgi:hypothetical protein
VVDAYRALRGRPPLDVYAGDPVNISATRVINLSEARRVYPLVLREPCDKPRLEAAVARAKGQGIRVVLILPPRSPDGDRMLGPELTRDLASRADTYARRLGVPLFAPHGDWRNDEFIDLAHVNQAGRAHFQQDLRRWWANPR